MNAYVTDIGGLLTIVGAAAVVVAPIGAVVVVLAIDCINLGADKSLTGGVLLLFTLLINV